MKTRIIMVRHAEAEGNLKRVFHGWTDSEITEKGHKQAMLVAERLKDEKIDALYSSSLKRTMQTAEYISKMNGLPIIKTDKLKEINGGEWEGLGWHELADKYPDEYYTWEHRLYDHIMPGGESVVEFRKRLVSEFERIVNEHPDKTICIVTHGTAIRVLLCHFYDCGLEGILGIPWADNTAVTIMEYQCGKYKVITEGDASHLTKELSTIRNQAWYDTYMEDLQARRQKNGWWREQTRGQMREQMKEQMREQMRDRIREQITDRLFETEAIKVCPPGKPFWYTSGKIGPYYVNTHFLFGNEKKAVEMLNFIDQVMHFKTECPVKVLEKCRANYSDDSIYRGVTDCLIRYIDENIGRENVDYISGGERRDWFFSIITADILNIPHITLYKSGESVILHKGKVLDSMNMAGTDAKENGMKDTNVENASVEVTSAKDSCPEGTCIECTSTSIEGASVLHIADLINEASSYLESWIPAVEKMKGKIKWSVAVVDRLQGGAQNLVSAGVEPHSLTEVDRKMFSRAYETGVIGKDEYNMILQYLEDPDRAMQKFIENNPGFMQEALNADEKTASRARKCLREGYYGTSALQ